MSNNTTTQKTTFWKFLEEHTIEIPIIQRDYAQGRKGKEELRKTFLCNLRAALDKNPPLTLDFVYGSNENSRLNPLDGQQRLTTLWLLHWYVAYKAGKLTDEVVKIFKNFKYETRITSREFCEHLAEFKTIKPDNFKGTISDFIQQQMWFYSVWKQDSTIQSMLRMLSGTPNKDKNGEDIVDGLEELFAKEPKFEEYWTKLSGENCPISFYNLDLGELKLTDDLYIKMNGRGEQLTSFENFKADLIGYIREQQKEAEDTAKEQWEKLLSPTDGVPIKMDTTWTDIFWKNKTEDGKIDDIYFAFLNRFFLNEFICKKNADGKYETTKDDPTSKLLYGENPYQSFEKYKACITDTALQSLNATLNNFAKVVEEINILFQPNWSKDENGNVKIVFDFIPDYKDGGSITTLTQPQRIVFYAICKYFEEDAYEEQSFKQWMRVVWNLAENGAIETIDAMIGNLRLIDELCEHSHRIYEFLANGTPISSKVNSSQVKEEIEKAKKILSDNSWEVKIQEAENYAFFKGSIRFLFHDGDGKLDWANFDTKWENAQKYFDKNGLKDEHKVSITKALVIQCTDWNNQLYNQQIFNPNAATWKWILCANNWISPIHNILMENIIKTDSFKDKVKDGGENKDILPIIDKIPFKKIIEKIPEGRFYWNGQRFAIYKPYGHDAIVFDRDRARNNILSIAVNNEQITTDQKIDGCDFFWGWNIKFRYKKDGVNHYFEWNRDDQIYLMDNKWYRIKKDNKDVKIGTSQITSDIFLEQLDKLISLNNPSQTDVEKTEV